MIAPKYYDRIHELRARDPFTRLGPPAPFSIDDLAPKGVLGRIGAWFAGLLFRIAVPLLRAFVPVFRFGRFTVVTRMEDVRDVLDQPDVFHVPYGTEMRELGGGADFVLGIDGDEHAEQRRAIGSVLRSDDYGADDATQSEAIRYALRQGDLERLTRDTARVARALIAASAGRIDVMRDLITRTATETCAAYFGLDVKEPEAFAEWSMGVSAMLFADPTGDETPRRLGLYGAARIREIADRAIAGAEAREEEHIPNEDLVVDRLLAALKDLGRAERRRQVRTILVGLVTGFVPTTALAAGNILSELLRRPRVLDRAMALARADDRAGLEAILWEAARLNPALNPGQWRIAATAGVIARGTTRETRVPAGTVVSVATASALRDHRAFDHPNAFDPDRPLGGGRLAGELMFGAGVHKCLGQHITMAQMAEIFAVLLAQPNLRRAKGRDGRLVTAGPYPRRLDMTFDPPVAPASQSMVVVVAPVVAGVTLKTLQDEIQALLCDPGGRKQLPKAVVADALDATRIVHFASLSAIDVGTDDAPSPRLVLELNVDGGQDAALDVFALHAGDLFRPIFDAYAANPNGLPLAELLKARALRLHSWPWGATGLNFNGTPEFSVVDIERQALLARFARAALDIHLRDPSRSNRPMAALDLVRDLIRDPEWLAEEAKHDHRLEPLLRRHEEFAAFLIRPSRRRLRISDWTEPQGFDAVWQVIKGRAGRLVGALVLVLILAFGALSYMGLAATGAPGLAGRLILALVGGVLATGVLMAAVYGAAVVLLRRAEAADLPDPRHPGLEKMQAVAEVENHPGYAQNHFMAVTALKPGWVRRGALALALWGVKQLVTYWFRPGFVLNMGTIHYAKWFRLPDTGKLIFLANYDGSWESYLEDFITRAHQGQTAVWSNGLGFPDTRFLVGDGAQDGDMFKRWVRRQQVVTQFWYSRFPDLTTDQIRNNALIHDGLARAGTDTAARAWLDCLGSMQRPDYAIETEEVQSLVFRGMGEMPYSACVLVRLPSERAAQRLWIHAMMGTEFPAAGHLPHPIPSVRFGDRRTGRHEGAASFVAFSAAGLERLGLPRKDGEPGLASFPAVFNTGMAARKAVLGDSPDAAWGWSDREADAVVLFYDRTLAGCENAVASLRTCLGDGGVLRTIYTPAPRSQSGKAPRRQMPLDYEHFGFRDGISQPVIRGTRRFVSGVALRDVVEPGEFIFGYRANQGYFPPSPTVPIGSDVKDRLPIAAAESPERFPDFGANTPSTSFRDFGRNGSFLVIRQLEQHVDRFKEATAGAAADLIDRYPDLQRVVGEKIDGDWVAAKMVGRRKDGSPLIERTAQHRHGERAPRRDRLSRGEQLSFEETVRLKAMARFFEERLGDTAPPGGGRPLADVLAEALDAAPTLHREPADGAPPPADEGRPAAAAAARAPQAVRVSRADPVAAQQIVDPANDFTFGLDDPRGLQCPLGAHIRRANPRDSLQPGDAQELEISNRHRLLRRGRTYRDGEEKGLLFMALCADLERQFEFVQQTWVGSPSFHGLTDEPDPIAAGAEALCPRAGAARERVFTIPTPVGAVTVRGLESFVTTLAGGYFFLPSRSALAYLAALPEPDAEA